MTRVVRELVQEPPVKGLRCKPEPFCKRARRRGRRAWPKLPAYNPLESSMTTWEYASILNDGPAPKPTLDGLGADGWELVSVLQGTETKQILYVFKRPRAEA